MGRRHIFLQGRGRAINGNVFREQTLLEPDLEGQRELEQVEELGEAFQDMLVLEARVSVACSWDNDLSLIRAKQASLWGVEGNKVHEVEPEYKEL